MKINKLLALGLSGLLILSMTACGNTQTQAVSQSESVSSAEEAPAEEPQEEETAGEQASSSEEAPEETAASKEDSSSSKEVSTSLDQLDMTKWLYNEEDSVYYQLGIAYCSDPADASYETLAVFVPDVYMDGVANGDGTYTCVLNEDGEINGYTARTAPIVMPINTPGYSAQKALTEYTSVSSYTDAGFVYVHAGCRGRDSGAPAGVTDLKAAIRYVRWCDEVLAGDAESIFTFGMSGGGAQSAIVGSSGDSALYDAYLAEIGAIEGVSDAVLGSMCWCPITNLDSADAAYEWMMGSTRSGLSEDEQAISDALAEAFAEYVNEAGILDPEGNILTLEESEEGIWQAGSYYEYLKGVVEQSLNNFLADTKFPYDASSSGSRGGFGGFGGNSGPGAGFGPGGSGRPEGGERPERGSGEQAAAESAEAEGELSFEEMDNISRTSAGSGLTLSGTYETAADYIAAMNADVEWVTYDEETNTATITSIDAFVNAFKTASKSLGAFDQLDEGQGENELFGYGDGNGAHFDAALAAILETLGNDAAADYAEDLAAVDSVGNTPDTRLDMYTPLYYLMESYDGYETSNVAKYWRIRTGIAQGDTSLSTEVNLALALENYETVEDVDFETVWGEGHTMAERTGDSTTNFIEWVNECMK